MRPQLNRKKVVLRLRRFTNVMLNFLNYLSLFLSLFLKSFVRITLHQKNLHLHLMIGSHCCRRTKKKAYDDDAAAITFRWLITDSYKQKKPHKYLKMGKDTNRNGSFNKIQTSFFV
jgi:hypothetical protein